MAAINVPTLNEDWHVLLSMFPENWQELAAESNAIVRKLRSFKDEERNVTEVEMGLKEIRKNCFMRINMHILKL